MSITNSNRRRTYGGLAPGEADFTITLARNVSDPSKIVSVEGDGMEDFLKRFRRCLMKSTKDHHAYICYLDDSNSNYYYDGSDAKLISGDGRDVMVYFPEFWYKGESDSSSHKIHISTSQIDGYYHSPASLVGAYKGYVTDNKLYSRSEMKRSTSESMVKFHEYSRNRGKGFHLIDYMQHRTIAWMFYTRYKNTNSQAICGTGTDTYSGVYNGVTNSLGMKDTTPSTANISNMLVNFLGIEGCWGYVSEFIEGIHSYSSDNAVIAYDKPDLRNGTADYFEYDSPYSRLESDFYHPTLRKLNTGSSLGGYISDIWGGDYGDMTIIRSKSGSSSAYYCDYGVVSPSSTYVFLRSDYNADSYGGVSYLYCNGSSSLDSSRGSRLAFDGTLEEMSVADFEAISNWR